MLAVADVLIADGLLNRTPFPSNPVSLVERLFQSGHFMGVLRNDVWHAFALVPVVKPTRTEFVLKIDSLGGSLEWLGVREFLEMLLPGQHAEGNMEIYFVPNHSQ